MRFDFYVERLFFDLPINTPLVYYNIWFIFILLTIIIPLFLYFRNIFAVKNLIISLICDIIEIVSKKESVIMIEYTFVKNMVLSELAAVLSVVDETAVNEFIAMLEQAGRVFAAGVGRPQLSLLAFVKRVAGFPEMCRSDVAETLGIIYTMAGLTGTKI